MKGEKLMAETMPEEPVKRDGAVFKAEDYKKDFPILSRLIRGTKLVYLDSAATTQKPQIVIDAVEQYYRLHNANVHRGLHTLAEEATSAYEATRDKIAEFLGGVNRQEIIYTRNATEAINMVASSWGYQHIKKGDRIVITQMEHHANLVPWLVLAKRTGAELVYIPIDPEGYLDLTNLKDIIAPNTKIVALTHMSNVLGTINPVEEVIALAHKRGALALIDGAQSVPHMPVNLKAMNADFLAFSAHKMLGPTGLGVLYGKEEFLQDMEPVQFGGEMISEVRYDGAKWNELPHKFEAGTPNIEGAFAFLPALEYLEKIGMEKIRRHEMDLTAYALDKLGQLEFIKVFGPKDVKYRGGAVSFVDKDIHPHDMATFLDTLGIAVRAGHHCAQPLTRLLGINSTTRASFYLYNTHDDIDQLVTGLKEARRYFRHE
ncbi:selenocysteine lyase, PLP-dependent [Candidatus Zixiibacteriota bacterium]|nr:selenocysteine lyase, PLP-dependent [candidate division Zixibacteria bacterium]